MGKLTTVSAFSFSSKAYIQEMQKKIKGLVYMDVEVQLGFEKALGLIQTRLDLLLDFAKDVEEANGAVGSAKASEEEIRARKRYLDNEFGIAVSMCHVVDHFTVRRRILFGGVFDDVDDFDKFPSSYQNKSKEKDGEIKWFKTQMDEFTQRVGSFVVGKHNVRTSGFGIEKRQGRVSDKEQLTVIGLEVDVQVLSQQLVQEMCERIWIVGAQGIGKTTLAMKVWDNSIVGHHFELHIWVTISPQYELRDILQNLMKKIPVRYLPRSTKYSTDTTPELAAQILHVFRSVRCLIVLDGLQTYEALESLGMDGKDGKRAYFAYSRIMITTRSMELANRVKRTNHIIHEMRTLGDQDAWVLFNTKVHVPIQFEKLGIELVRKCMGHPLRILELANVFSETPVTEDEMLKLLTQDLDRNQVSVFNELEVAVNSLPSHLKECLSSFELFNDDFEIPMRRLIAYWVAEGNVQQEGGSKEPPEALAEKQLMDFIRQNMIQVAKWKINGRVKTCRLNYFLRNNWLSKVEKEKAAYNKKKKDAAFKLSNFLDANHKKVASTSSSGTGMIIRIADHLNNKEKSFSHIHGNQKISQSSLKENYGDLCSLVSFDTREGPVPGEAIGTFLRRGIAARCFTMMRVLDLEGVFRPNLPEIIQKLLQLRYLGLRSTYIEGLPSTIGKLLSLQTLDLKHTCIRSLPCSVWNIQQLRHIYLSESYRSRVLAPPKSSSLVDFQTLWGAFVDEETPIVNGLDRLINLRKLSLVCRLRTTQQTELACWISGLDHLESLRLRSVNELVRPSDIYLKSLSGLHKLSSIYILGRLMDPVVMHELPVSVTEITLSFSKLVDDPMRKLQKLPNLRILNLYAASYTGKTMVVSSGGFPLLRVLNLWKLEELEEWTINQGGLVILRDLEIRSCNKLKKIPRDVLRLELCQELKLTNMPDEFRARVTANTGQDWYKIAHIPSVIIKN